MIHIQFPALSYMEVDGRAKRPREASGAQGMDSDADENAAPSSSARKAALLPPKTPGSAAGGGPGSAAPPPGGKYAGKRTHELMHAYYRRLFPTKDMCRWLAYGNDRRSLQARGAAVALLAPPFFLLLAVVVRRGRPLGESL